MAEVLRVLVVDDDQQLRDLLVAALEIHGVAVSTAADGIDALRSMNYHNPDVVIADMRMPRRDGLDFCRELRATSRWKEVPVVILSGLDAADHRLRQVADISGVAVRQKGPGITSVVSEAVEMGRARALVGTGAGLS